MNTPAVNPAFYTVKLIVPGRFIKYQDLIPILTLKFLVIVNLLKLPEPIMKNRIGREK